MSLYCLMDDFDRFIKFSSKTVGNISGDTMEKQVKGLHHITAIAGGAKQNHNFYTNVLGLRLVKKTVNFDDPYTYHFYFGDEVGTPGTILTFFPWEGMRPGRRGISQVTEIGYSVPENSLDFWLKRLDTHNVTYNKPAEKFGETYLTLLDPDGLKLELTVVPNDGRKVWTTADIAAEQALRGFHHVTLTLDRIEPTAAILTDLFGYQLKEQHVNRYRFVTDAVGVAATIDLVEAKGESAGMMGSGSVHHVAFRVKDDATQMALREKIVARGLQITPQIDRQYFHSLYFREPGGVLFEIATDNPGFAIDEPVEALGTNLKLPPQYEGQRTAIANQLPKL